MTNCLNNSSEVREAAERIQSLLVAIPDSLINEVAHEARSFTPPPGEEKQETGQHLFAETTGSDMMVSAPPSSVEHVSGVAESEFVGDRLENLLMRLCRQSGFQSAVVADHQGLTIAEHNTPIEGDQLSAFSSVLGSVIDKIPQFFGQYDANNISVDINYADKAVVRKFLVGDTPFFLLIICSQDIDERAYIELFSDQITTFLDR